MAVALTTTLQDENGNTHGGAFNHATASTRQIAKDLIAPDDTEVVEATEMANARLLIVENNSTLADNTLSVGLATGSYQDEIPPGAVGKRWLVGKPTNPSLYFKFVNAAGGPYKYVLRD